MPYTRPNKTSTAGRQAVRRPRRALEEAGGQNPAATLIESTGGTWNFTARIWIAFDPPTSTSPTWIDISGFVQMDSPITTTHGRPDGLSDVSATTCQLTVDNSDGRFSPANPNGVWFGQIHKGSWLKVEIFPPSGTISSRFVGFITSLPNQWSGQSQYGQISAADRFEKLQQTAAIVTSIESEVLTDPNLSGSIKAYWNLHEAQGSLTFGDTSGQGVRYLQAIGLGTLAGIGMGAANVDAPGFDGARAVTFNPVSVSQGTYLYGLISTPTGTWTTSNYTGQLGVCEFWFQAATTGANQYLIALIDNLAQQGFSLYFDANGYINLIISGTTPTNPVWGFQGTYNATPRIDDGKWHHVVLGVNTSSSNGGMVSVCLVIDSIQVEQFVATNGTGGTPSNGLTNIIVGAGYDTINPGILKLGQANISDVSWYWSDLVNSTGAAPANIFDHYAAGLNGFLGETTDRRVARVARYGGVPIPLVSSSAGPFTPLVGFPALANPKVYAAGLGPWTNLATGAHLVGTQSMAGRKPLDVMLEAAHTEGMPLYVDRSGYLTIQPSTTRQNTLPAWTVNALDLDPSTQVADDHAYTTNQMTITPNGLAAQTVIGLPGSAGRLSQAKYGVYDGSQSTASVNPIEAQSLGLGIIQQRADLPPRLAPLAVEVATAAKLPAYGTAWYDAVLATEISTPIRVTNAPLAVGGGNYDCLVEGWTETITAGNHLISFTTSPIQGPTYQLDDAVLGRLDTDGTTLVGALNSTATTFTAAVATATSAAWTTSTADFPFDILMDAEQMTVSSIAPVSIGVDGTFETSATGWTLTGCTLVQSTAQAHSGTHSGLVTATATGTVAVVTPQVTVYPNATYQLGHWMMLASGTPNNVFGKVTWYTSGGTFISSVPNPLALTPQASWRNNASQVTAPSNAGLATFTITFTSAASGNAIYLDDVVFPLLTGGQQQFTVTRSVNGVVASHTSGAALALAEPLTLAY